MSEEDNTYPKPFIVKPRGQHKQSFILLHGRGDTGKDFGTGLLFSSTTFTPPASQGRPGSATFASMFPDAKFIFPTAKSRRAKWYGQLKLNQWFDNVPIDEQDRGVTKEQEEWQLEGLRQTREVVNSIIDEEIQLVGAKNVFLGGLSQGCAMALHVLLSYGGERSLGGFIGISGWLPFVDAMEEAINPLKGSEMDPDRMRIPGDQVKSHDLSAQKVCDFVRANLDLPPISPPSLSGTPVFLGHGKSDDRVKMAKGLRAANFLKALGVEIDWKQFDIGHWYKVPEEIDSIIDFVQACLLRQEI